MRGLAGDNFKRAVRVWVVICLAAGGVIFVLAGAAASDNYWNLARCLDFSRTHSPKVRMAQKGIEAARLDLKDAAVRFRPDVTVRLGYDVTEMEPEEGFAFQLRVSEIFDGYKKFYDGRLAELEYEISLLKEHKAAFWAEYQVAWVYLSLLAGAKRAGLTLGMIALAREKEAVLQTLLNQGLADPLLVRQAQLAAKSQELALAEEEALNRSAEASLKALIGLEPGAAFGLDATQELSAVASELPAPPADNIDLALAELRADALAQIEKMTAMEKWPSPVLAVGWSEGGIYETTGFYILLGANLPLYTAGRQQRQVERRRLALDRHRLEQARLAEALALKTAEVAAEIELGQRRLDLAREEVALALDRLRVTAAAVERGKAWSLELIEARIAAGKSEAVALAAELGLCQNRLSLWALDQVVLE